MEKPEDMSVEQLEALLAQKRKAEETRKRREREAYEKNVDEKITTIVEKAIGKSGLLYDFYKESIRTLEELREKLNQYGEIKSTSKGGFQRKSADGRYKVIYKYATICDWDERSLKAEELLKDFLKDVVKKRDQALFDIIISLIEKNKDGKLEYSRIQTLYSHEGKFDDPRWKEAIRLFKESFRATGSKYRLDFYVRNDATGKYDQIPLNFSNF